MANLSSRLTLLTVVFGLMVVSAGDACSVALNTSAVQCLSESECLAKGFANTTCDPVTKTCVPVDPNAGLCQANQDCITANGGSPAICLKSDHKCVLLESPECPHVRGSTTDIANDNTVVIGELTGFATQILTEHEAAMALALQDFTKTVGGLPPVTGSTALRPVVMVSCDEKYADAAANHLVNDIHVPLLLGPIAADQARVVLTKYALPNKVVSILPLNEVSSLAKLPNPLAPTPMVWSLAAPDTSIGAVMSSFLNDDLCVPATGGATGCDPTKSRLVTKGIVPASTPIKVMLVQQGTLDGLSLANVLETKLKFNCNLLNGNCGTLDNSAATPPAGWTFSWPLFEVGDMGNNLDPLTTPDPKATAAKVVAQVLKFQPNVIFHAAEPDQDVIVGVEQQWATANPGVPFPIEVVLSTWAAAPAAQVPTKAPYGQASDLRHRIFFAGDIQPQPSSETNAFASRFNAAYPEFNGLINYEMYLTSDAAYVGLYGMAAVGSAPMTGQNIATALARGSLNPPGQVISADPTLFSQGISIVANGGNFDFNGLSGPLDFNLADGTNPSDAQIGCYDSTYTLQASGYIWDHTSGAGTGSVTNCN